MPEEIIAHKSPPSPHLEGFAAHSQVSHSLYGALGFELWRLTAPICG